LPDPKYEVSDHPFSTGFKQSPVGRHKATLVPGSQRQVKSVIDSYTVPDGEFECGSGPALGCVTLDRDP
jgi:hypothetical protein